MHRRSAAELAKHLGKAEWGGVCAKCHGMQGQGDIGPALASNAILTQKARLEALLRKGGSPMPAVGDNWSDTQMPR